MLYGYVKTTCWKGSFNQQALPAALVFTWSTPRPVSHIMAAHQHHLVHGCECRHILTVIRRLSYWSAFTRREYVEDQIVLLFSWWTKLPTSNLKDFNHTKWLAKRSISVSAKALTSELFKIWYPQTSQTCFNSIGNWWIRGATKLGDRAQSCNFPLKKQQQQQQQHWYLPEFDSRCLRKKSKLNDTHDHKTCPSIQTTLDLVVAFGDVQW